MNIADLKPILLPTKIIQVNENLYRGNAVYSPVKALRIKGKGIKQVIDLRHEDGTMVRLLKSLEKIYLKTLGIKYINKRFYKDGIETVPDIAFFEGINEQINKNKTYIHCHFGKHRTGFAVAMYEKSAGMPEDTIMEQLMDNEWDTAKRKNLLNQFLNKFFKK